MKKEMLVLNQFTYLNNEMVYISDDFDILDIIVKLKDNGLLDVLSIMKHKKSTQRIKEYYSYHHFEIILKDIELNKTEVLNKLKEMYLNGELETEGESCSGTKTQIIEELINDFSLQKSILTNRLKDK